MNSEVVASIIREEGKPWRLKYNKLTKSDLAAEVAKLAQALDDIETVYNIGCRCCVENIRTARLALMPE